MLITDVYLFSVMVIVIIPKGSLMGLQFAPAIISSSSSSPSLQIKCSHVVVALMRFVDSWLYLGM
jgi:hypothetical protein